MSSTLNPACPQFRSGTYEHNQVKKLSKEAEESSTGAAGDGDGKKTSPSSDWDDEGHEDDDEGDHETSSATERLRDGIHAALSSIVPYKKHWPHVRALDVLGATPVSSALCVC